MKYRFTQNLGSDDAAACNKACESRLKYKECVIDAVVDVSESAAAWLSSKYCGLLEPADKIKGIPSKSEITAPAK